MGARGSQGGRTNWSRSAPYPGPAPDGESLLSIRPAPGKSGNRCTGCSRSHARSLSWGGSIAKGEGTSGAPWGLFRDLAAAPQDEGCVSDRMDCLSLIAPLTPQRHHRARSGDHVGSKRRASPDRDGRHKAGHDDRGYDEGAPCHPRPGSCPWRKLLPARLLMDRQAQNGTRKVRQADDQHEGRQGHAQKEGGDKEGLHGITCQGHDGNSVLLAAFRQSSRRGYSVLACARTHPAMTAPSFDGATRPLGAIPSSDRPRTVLIP